jgi:predicted nucleotide-binding protein
MIIMAGHRTPAREYQAGVTRNIENTFALLQEAQRVLNEDLSDVQTTALPAPAVPKETSLSRRVFVVHGHDGEARDMAARFLKAMDFEPVILHEQANQGGTVIEKFDANSDVGFARRAADARRRGP